MEYKQWFSCEGCKALKGNSSGVYCRLAFKLDKQNISPLEPCPKPSTPEKSLVCELLGYNKWDRLQDEQAKLAQNAVDSLDRALEMANRILKKTE